MSTLHKVMDEIPLLEICNRGCKLHVEAWSRFTRDLIFCLQERISKWNAFSV